jgi:hypothetical protein
LDIYGSILTDKQRDAIELYYNEDLSLAEIAQHAGITRQGVRDNIQRGRQTLLEMEAKLGIAERITAYSRALERIGECAVTLKASRSDINFYRILDENVATIINTVKAVNDDV